MDRRGQRRPRAWHVGDVRHTSAVLTVEARGRRPVGSIAGAVVPPDTGTGRADTVVKPSSKPWHAIGVVRHTLEFHTHI